jgi:hypothetical protein
VRLPGCSADRSRNIHTVGRSMLPFEASVRVRTQGRDLGRVEERSHPPAPREPRLDEGAGALRLAVEQADANGEDDVEAAVAEVEVLEARDDELGLACLDVCGVATSPPPRSSSPSGRSRSAGLRRVAPRPSSRPRRARTRSRGPGRWADTELIDDRLQSFAHRPDDAPAVGSPPFRFRSVEGDAADSAHSCATVSSPSLSRGFRLPAVVMRRVRSSGAGGVGRARSGCRMGRRAGSAARRGR